MPNTQCGQINGLYLDIKDGSINKNMETIKLFMQDPRFLNEQALQFWQNDKSGVVIDVDKLELYHEWLLISNHILDEMSNYLNPNSYGCYWGSRIPDMKVFFNFFAEKCITILDHFSEEIQKIPDMEGFSANDKSNVLNNAKVIKEKNKKRLEDSVSNQDNSVPHEETIENNNQEVTTEQRFDKIEDQMVILSNQDNNVLLQNNSFTTQAQSTSTTVFEYIKKFENDCNHLFCLDTSDSQKVEKNHKAQEILIITNLLSELKNKKTDNTQDIKKTIVEMRTLIKEALPKLEKCLPKGDLIINACKRLLNKLVNLFNHMSKGSFLLFKEKKGEGQIKVEALDQDLVDTPNDLKNDESNSSPQQNNNN